MNKEIRINPLHHSKVYFPLNLSDLRYDFILLMQDFEERAVEYLGEKVATLNEDLPADFLAKSQEPDSK